MNNEGVSHDVITITDHVNVCIHIQYTKIVQSRYINSVISEKWHGW